MSNYNYEEGKITGKNELELYYQSWLSPKEKSILVVVHGLGEHSGRYSNLIEQLNGKGISLYAMDLRGHGRSEGKRGHVDSFLDYVHDLKAFIELIKEKHASVPVFMFGHSMGATIATRYTLTYQEDLSGVILSALALKPLVEISPMVQGLGSIIGKLFPSLQQPNGIDPALLSHDEEVVALYQQDEYNHDRATLRFYSEFMGNAENCMDRAIEIRVPMLLLHGGDDGISDPEGSELIYEKISSTDKEIKIFEGLYHEVINEIGKDSAKVLTLISKWLTAHATKAAKAAPKTTAKKATKKATKTAAKKAVKKTAKKVAKKTAKKAAKKVTKKTAKKTAKKVTKKAAKKTAKKTTKKSKKK